MCDWVKWFMVYLGSRSTLKLQIYKIFTTLLCILALAIGATAEDFRIAKVYEGDTYFIDLLKVALNNHPKQHTLTVIDISIGQARLVSATIENKGLWNIIYTGYTPQRSRKMQQVNIPLTRGLLGQRVLVIRPSSQNVFDRLQGEGDFLKTITLGTNSAWLDARLMKSYGFKTREAPTHSLYPMLMRGRFTAFPRGVNEVNVELENLGKKGTVSLAIENNYILKYKMDTFFYVSRKNQHLAEIVETGLEHSIDNGSFKTFFYSNEKNCQALKLIANRHKVINLPLTKYNRDLNRIPNSYWLGTNLAGEVAQHCDLRQ